MTDGKKKRRSQVDSPIADAEVPRIRERRANGELLKNLALEYGVTKSSILRIARGDRRKGAK